MNRRFSWKKLLKSYAHQEVHISGVIGVNVKRPVDPSCSGNTPDAMEGALGNQRQ